MLVHEWLQLYAQGVEEPVGHVPQAHDQGKLYPLGIVEVLAQLFLCFVAGLALQRGLLHVAQYETLQRGEQRTALVLVDSAQLLLGYTQLPYAQGSMVRSSVAGLVQGADLEHRELP